MKEEELIKLEKKLWESADKMRGAVPVSDYKFIILGLIFLKYISDAFEEKYQILVKDGYGLEEDRDSYEADNVFYVPARARWEYLNAHSKDPHIGQIIDDALEEIERECLEALEEYDRRYHADYVETLKSYLKHNGSIQAVAAELYTHRNTVLYRIGNIRKILGNELKTPEERLPYQIAFYIRSMHGSKE